MEIKKYKRDPKNSKKIIVSLTDIEFDNEKELIDFLKKIKQKR